MCFGHYNKYHKLVFETLGMDKKWWTDPQYSSLEKLAENGKYTDVVAALHEACLALTFDEIQERFRKNDIPFEKIQSVKDVLEDEEAFKNDQLRRVV